MRVLIVGCVLLCGIMLAGAAVAQDPPPPTPTLAPVIPPTATPPPPVVTPLPNLDTFSPGDDLNGILLKVRNDIEILANATLGTAVRPLGWSGSYAIEDPQMAVLARLDLEILADQLSPTRPPGWFGIQASTSYAIARDIRHDLELLADVHVAPNVRPPNWIGDDPLMRCNRSTQALVTLLLDRNVYAPAALPGSPTYCADLEAEISIYVEVNLIGGGSVVSPDVQAAAPTIPPPTAVPGVTVTSANAFAYYDRGALEVAGSIPAGTLLEPIARSYAQFSRMMLVRGSEFVLFVDYQDTSLDLQAFEALPDVDNTDFTTSCLPEWCGAAN